MTPVEIFPFDNIIFYQWMGKLLHRLQLLFDCEFLCFLPDFFTTWFASSSLHPTLSIYTSCNQVFMILQQIMVYCDVFSIKEDFSLLKIWLSVERHQPFILCYVMRIDVYSKPSMILYFSFYQKMELHQK